MVEAVKGENPLRELAKGDVFFFGPTITYLLPAVKIQPNMYEHGIVF